MIHSPLICAPVNNCWREAVELLLTTPYTPTGTQTILGQTHKPNREIIGFTTVVDMTKPIMSIVARKLNYKFMYAEAYWILSGSNKLSDIEPYCKPMASFSDDGIILQGAYGPPIVDQLQYVVEALKYDSTTRQAVLTTWNRSPVPSKDIPCTVSTQFLIRDKKLHLIHEMRSSDIWLGFCYDIFNFTMVAAYVALLLRDTYPELELGDLHFRAGSLHLYHINNERAAEIRFKPNAIGYTRLSLEHFRDAEDLKLWLIYRRDGHEHPHRFAHELNKLKKVQIGIVDPECHSGEGNLKLSDD